MNKTAAFTDQEANHKAQAQSYLAEAQRILRHLAAERRREERRRVNQPSIFSEVKAILKAA